jgi:hypothetical protein
LGERVGVRGLMGVKTNMRPLIRLRVDLFVMQNDGFRFLRRRCKRPERVAVFVSCTATGFNTFLIKEDGFAKNPSERYASLRVCVLRHPLSPTCQAVALAKDDRHCVPTSVGTRSSGFARLELGAFYFAISSMTFYVFIKENDTNTRHIQVPGTGKTGGI